jgi:hypothetical protein
MVKLDTGAQVNVMPVKVYNSLKTKSKVLQPTKVKLTAYGGNRIPVLGTCQLKCKYKNEAHNLEFYVVNTCHCFHCFEFKNMPRPIINQSYNDGE